nr:hypothetical protein [Anaerolineae bacterium]
MSRLGLYLFGPPRLEHDGEPIVVNRRKAMALMAYLAVSGQSHSRLALATLFWLQADQRHAQASLRSTLWALNKTPLAPYLDVGPETIGLHPEIDMYVDVSHFRRLLAACQTHAHPPNQMCPACQPLLSEAVGLYRADFLAGFTLADSPDFDEWQFFQTESLRQELASALERLVRGYSDQAAYESAIPFAQRWLALDPLHEPAHRQLMQLYAWTDDRAAALRQYQVCVRAFEAEFGLPPSAETTTLYQHIRQ